MATDTPVKGQFLKLRLEMATRKKYTREFKQDAVRLVTEQGYNKATTRQRQPGIWAWIGVFWRGG
jgi:hypothetical protein